MTSRTINKRAVFWLFIPVIVIAKIIRYTLLYELIDNAIGNNWIDLINSNLTASEILSMKIAEGQNGFAILFFKYINIFGINTYFEYEIFITIIFNLIILGLLFKLKNKLTIFELVFVLLFVAVLNIFDFTLSKDSLQMISFLLIFIVLLGNNRHKNLGSFLIILLTSLFFRRYYILILVFGIETKLILDLFFNNKSNNYIKAIMSLLIITLTYIFILELLRRVMPNYYLEFLRVRGRLTNANTNIYNLLENNSIINAGLNYILVVIRLLFPFELLLKGPKYLIFVTFQTTITIYIIKCIKRYNFIDNSQKLSLYICLGFVLTSATFEPDFGSWIRHEAVLFPIFIILFNFLKSCFYKYENIINKKD